MADEWAAQMFANFMGAPFQELTKDFQKFETLFLRPYFRQLPFDAQLTMGQGCGEVENTSDAFKMKIDVSQFMPQDLEVKLHGSQVIVAGTQEEKPDQYGTIQRSFVRKIDLPSGVHIDGLRTYIDGDGVLSLEVPKRAQLPPGDGRKIPIELTRD
ncbi:unnamed protein product, partial [Mesorhabditis spiculigera]